MVRYGAPRHFKSFLTVFSQNCRGLKTDEHVTELLDVLQQRRAFAACVQETWRPGIEDQLCDGWRYLGVGPPLQKGRGTKGVGIFLSPLARRAHDAAGGEVHLEGLRVMAVRLVASTGGGRRSKPRGVFLLNSYAPTSDMSDQVWDDYYSDVTAALTHMRRGDLLVWCTDANASIGTGTASSARGAAVGPHGLDRITASGRRLLTFLELHELYALTTHFRKPVYGTWWHPASRKPYQIDHIVTAARDRKCFLDAGSRPGQLIDSDHKPVACKLRLVVRPGNRPSEGSRMRMHDFGELLDAHSRNAFADAVATRVAAAQGCDAEAVARAGANAAAESTARAGNDAAAGDLAVAAAHATCAWKQAQLAAGVTTVPWLPPSCPLDADQSARELAATRRDLGVHVRGMLQQQLASQTPSLPQASYGTSSCLSSLTATSPVMG